MSRILATVIFILLVLAGGVMFASLNAGIVHVDYFLSAIDTSLAAALLFAMIFGFLLGLLAAGVWIVRLKSEAGRRRKQVRLMEAELKNLRNAPLRHG